VLILLAFGAFLRVADAGPMDDPLVSLFGTTCFAQYTNLDGLRSNLQRDKFQELNGTAAKPFLGPGTGRVWISSFQGSQYAIAVRDDGVCAVFAQQALVERVRKRFVETFSTTSLPFESKEVPMRSPNSMTHTIAYGWAQPTASTQLLFTLTTVDDPSAGIQAMLSMARIKR